MISSNCSISEFLNEVKNRDLLDIIHLADLEATAAERMLLRPSTDGRQRETCWLQYAESLKALIHHLRCSAKQETVGYDEIQLFQLLQEQAQSLGCAGRPEYGP